MSQLKYENLSIQERKLLLLKVLGLTPDSIARVRNGEVFLSDALSERIREVMNNPEDTTQCAIVCQNIMRDGASYETLEPDMYLEHINGMKAGGGRFADDVTEAVAEEPEAIAEDGYAAFAAGIYPRPVLRYFARNIDLAIWMLIMDTFCRLVLGFDPLSNVSVFSVWPYFLIVVMLAVEPVFLHFFGTTPGKWITGVKITDLKGEKLSWGAAYLHSFRILRFGLGFMIPIYNVFRLIRCFIDCRYGHILPWDFGTRVDRPERPTASRVILLIAALFILGGADMIGNIYLERPRNRGAITGQEFYDNCAYLVKYDSITFSEVPIYGVETDENGCVTSVSYQFEVTEEDNEQYIQKRYNEIFVAYMALAGAQKDFSPFMFEYGTVSKDLSYCCFASNAFEYAGAKVTSDVKYTGYARNILSDYLYRLPDGTPYFILDFTVSVK